MLSQQNLIYLGIALLIVGIAFFAYQELQKHHTEIEKLRMQSQKLEKIIYAYNMRQWHQSTDPYLNDGGVNSDESDESDESNSDDSDDSDRDIPDNNMSSFIRQTLNSLGTPAGPSKVTISSGGKSFQFPVTPLITNQNDEDNIPDVDTFDVEKNNQYKDNGDVSGDGHRNSGDGDRDIGDVDGGDCGDNAGECLDEMEQNDFDIDESKNEEKSNTCNVPIRSGERKGELCGSAAKAKGMCLRHYRQENKIH
jgi:hypothetical protein